MVVVVAPLMLLLEPPLRCVPLRTTLVLAAAAVRLWTAVFVGASAAIDWAAMADGLAEGLAEGLAVGLAVGLVRGAWRCSCFAMMWRRRCSSMAASQRFLASSVRPMCQAKSLQPRA